MAEICPEADLGALVKLYGVPRVLTALQTLRIVEPGRVAEGRVRTACADFWSPTRNPSTILLETIGVRKARKREDLARRFSFAYIKANVDAVESGAKNLRQRYPDSFVTKCICAIEENDAKVTPEALEAKAQHATEQQRRVIEQQARKLQEASAIVQENAFAMQARAAAIAEFSKEDPAVLKLALDEVIATCNPILAGSHNSARAKHGDIEVAARHDLAHRVRERITAIVSKATRYTAPEKHA